MKVIPPIIVALTTTAIVTWILFEVLAWRYFNGPEFQQHLQALKEIIDEHNDIATYACELEDQGAFGIGHSDSSKYVNFASFSNTSRWNYRRDRHKAHYNAPNVHTCSLQVVRNASEQPFKYLIKYFNIPLTDESLNDVEQFGNTVSRLVITKDNLAKREAAIWESVNPPWYIHKFFKKRFERKTNMKFEPIVIPQPTYVFEYVSAGGNSSQRTIIKLTPKVIDGLINYMASRIRFKKSAAGQRALMTRSLRDEIRKRDNFTCQLCGVSLYDEPHLLLEIDHIVPVSKGGLTTLDNLQTLCWKCNRTKSNKLL